MRILITGGAGMLAADALEVLREGGHDVVGVGRGELDICRRDDVLARVVDVDAVVNCAAWTAVDAAETEEAAAFLVNAVGPANLAEAAVRVGARLVHVSTDYVFEGDAQEPYRVEDATAPRSAYGRTKLAGEWAVRAGCPDHLVLRTGWLYGAAGRCFPKTIAGVLAQRGRAAVVDDQVGPPTWPRDVATVLLAMLDADVAPGVHHVTSAGRATWFDFARAVAEESGLDPSIVAPIATVPGDRPAPRPSFSVLDHSATTAVGVEPIGDWRGRWARAAPAVLATGPVSVP